MMLSKNAYSKILVIGYWLSAIGYSAFAQTVTITPALIGSAGNFSTMSSTPFWSISSSVGEPIVTTDSCSNCGNVHYLTQGFQQPTVLAFSVTASASDTDICAGSNTTLLAFVTPSNIPPY